MGDIFFKEIDEKGRLPIPQGIRKKLGWEGDITLSLDIAEDALIIRKVSNNCVFCGESTDNFFRGKPICKGCANTISFQFQE